MLAYNCAWLAYFNSGVHDVRKQPATLELRRQQLEPLKQDADAALAEFTSLKRQSSTSLFPAATTATTLSNSSPTQPQASEANDAQPKFAPTSLVRVSAVSAYQALSKLADYKAATWDHAGATEAYQKALELAVWPLGDVPHTLAARHGLATCLHNLGKADEALPAWLDNLQLLAAKSADQSMQAHTYRGLGATLLLLHRPAEAIWALAAANNLLLQLHGADSPPLMDIFELLGLGHWALGSSAAALALAHTPLHVDGAAAPTWPLPAPPEEVDRAVLGSLYVGGAPADVVRSDAASVPASVHHEAALMYLDNARRLRREHQNTDWPEYLVCLRSYAELLMGVGRPDEAEIMWRELMSVSRKAYGPRHALTVRASVGYAHCLPPGSGCAESAYETLAGLLRDLDAAQQAELGFGAGECDALLAQVEAGLQDAKAGLVVRGGLWGVATTMQPLTRQAQTRSF